MDLTNLRNIWIIAHIDAWKTTFTERVLFYAGRIHKIWETHDWEWTMDWMEQEKERGITITSAATQCKWKDNTINIIDTPGHVDFTVEVERSLRVLDGWIAVFDWAMWVEPQSETVWRQADKYKVPRICFVNKMDKMWWDFYMSLWTIHQRLSKKAYAIQLPIWADSTFAWLVDIIENKAYKFELKFWENIIEIDIPEDMKSKVEEHKTILIEALAEEDEKFMEDYLEWNEITKEEIKRVIRKATVGWDFYPVLCWSALQNIWVQFALDGASDYLPSPLDVWEIVWTDVRDEEKKLTRKPEDGQASSALAFKIATDPFVWRLTFVRVYSWKLISWSYVYNPNTWTKERIWRLVKMHSNSREEVDEIGAWDIGAVIWLKNTKTWDTLCDEKHQIVLESMTFPETVISISIEPKTKADQDKMWQALWKLREEDPTFNVKSDEETNQTIISWMWELHLDILVDRMKREFKVEANIWEPQVAFRETIQLEVEAEEKYSKQTWGRGQYGHVIMTVEPNPGKWFEFVDKVVWWRIPKEYIPAVEKWLKEALTKWVVAGYPVVDVKVILLDWSYHDVDSSELAFKLAASIAFKNWAKKAKPVLLEPIMAVEVTTPEDYMWDVMWNISSKRWIISETYEQWMAKVIKASVPLSEMFGYVTELRSISSWRAAFSMEFEKYSIAPSGIVKKIKEDRGYE